MQAAGFLPLSAKEARSRGWNTLDFVYVTGDSYVDHPSFGAAIICRLLESLGFRVGIVSQPQSDADYMQFGQPHLGFFASSGSIDSMVSHYTSAKRKRSDDPYTAGGNAGRRPDRAVIVYSRKLKELFPGSPVIVGGLEASFRRFAHYDYWDNAVRPSILADSGADLLSYGMGELQTRQIALRLEAGEPISALTDIRGTCYLSSGTDLPQDSISCASFYKVSADKAAFARAYQIQLAEQDPITGKALVQKHGHDLYLVQNPPMRPLTTAELDQVFALPFMRTYHPAYEPLGGVKAIEEVEFSIMHNRGCFGGCNFCAIAFHQGRMLTARSVESVVEEARRMTQNPRFKGYIHDVGGATANFRAPSCQKQLKDGICRGRKCLAPKPCPQLTVSHAEYLDILRQIRALPGVKKVFVRSGLRYDYINLDRDDTFLRELVAHHTSGQLKVAPEHCSANVLDLMGKPHIDQYVRFEKTFYAVTKKAGKDQYLVPYLMSSHPGATLKDAVELALFLKKHKLRPLQVQDFYPTPGTASTCMFYTGLDPATMKPVYTATTDDDKAMQRALLQYFDPRNHALVCTALRKAGRADLIGTAPHCLVPPPRPAARTAKNSRPSSTNQSPPRGGVPQKDRRKERGPRKKHTL